MPPNNNEARDTPTLVRLPLHSNTEKESRARTTRAYGEAQDRPSAGSPNVRERDDLGAQLGWQRRKATPGFKFFSAACAERVAALGRAAAGRLFDLPSGADLDTEDAAALQDVHDARGPEQGTALPYDLYDAGEYFGRRRRSTIIVFPCLLDGSREVIDVVFIGIRNRRALRKGGVEPAIEVIDAAAVCVWTGSRAA